MITKKTNNDKCCWGHRERGVYTLLVTQPLWKSVAVLKALKLRTAQYSISITCGNIPKGFHTCRAKGGKSSAILPSNEHWPPREDVPTTETVAWRLGATQLPSGCLCDTAGRICVWNYEPHCLSFTSISEIKHPGPKQHRRKGVYFSLKCQVTPSLWESQVTSFKQLISIIPINMSKERHACMLPDC